MVLLCGAMGWDSSEKCIKIDNCAKWILELGDEQDFSINLFHVMDFGNGEFDIRILNDRKLVVHNMQEFLTAGASYLRGYK